jgi:NDP-sugar pyrophosphorylase family protein
MPVSGKFSITDTYINGASQMDIVGYDHTGEIMIDVGKPDAIEEAERMFK